MRNYKFVALLVLTATIFFYTNSSAQTTIDLGLEGGVNLSDMSFSPDVSTDTKTGILVGGIIDIGISRNFNIITGLRYIQKGFEQQASAFDVKTKIDYLEFPALVKVKFPMTELRPYVIAGPTLGIRMSAEQEVRDFDETETRDIDDEIESTDFGLFFGAGLDFGVGRSTSLFVQGGYGLGLSNVIETTLYDTKNRGIQLTAGVKFRLR